MKKLSILMLSLIALLCLLPFIGGCQEFDSKSWSDYISSKPERPEWLIDTDSILTDNMPTGEWNTFTSGTIDTIPTGFFGTTCFTARSDIQAPRTLKIIARESSIEFSLDKGLMTAKMVGSEDSVAQSFIDNIVCKYNSELQSLRNKVDSLSSVIDEFKENAGIPVLIKQGGTGSGYWQVDILAQENSHGLANIEGISVGDYIKFRDRGVEYKLQVTLVHECYRNYAMVRLSNVGIVGISSVPTTMGTLISH